jgi:CDP-4-dehydro-6-deoxyglucose reductase, E3
MVSFAKPQRFTARVIEKTALTAKVFRVRYQLVEPASIQFVAGQTIMLKVAENVNRAMSIASPPQENTVLTSFQDVSPGGPGSIWMIALNVGDDVSFMGPLGRFVVEHESPRKKIFVATGTGIAPFHSMLLDNTNNRIPCEVMSIYWGLRYKEDIFINDELEKIDRDCENLKYYLTLSRPTDDWTGLRGHVIEHIFANEKDLLNCDFYLCGNKKMINELTEKLMLVNVPRDRMKFDPFF